MIRVVLIGAGGRMGQEVMRSSQEFPDLKIVGGVERKDHQDFGRRYYSLESFSGRFDCAVDFSTPEATISSLSFLVKEEKPVVIGTTGFDAKTQKGIEHAALKIPIFLSPNMAYGMNLLIDWIPAVLKNLPDFDIEMIEIHHKYKKDAPSGTVRRIIDRIKTVRPELKKISGRSGPTGPRRRDEIGVFALRGGDVYGVHKLYLLGPGEEITITHRASSRSAFAFGALRAVRFITLQKPGLYTMEDLIQWEP